MLCSILVCLRESIVVDDISGGMSEPSQKRLDLATSDDLNCLYDFLYHLPTFILLDHSRFHLVKVPLFLFLFNLVWSFLVLPSLLVLPRLILSWHWSRLTLLRDFRSPVRSFFLGNRIDLVGWCGLFLHRSLGLISLWYWLLGLLLVSISILILWLWVLFLLLLLTISVDTLSRYWIITFLFTIDLLVAV